MTSVGSWTRPDQRPALPAAARLGCWLAACVDGRTSPVDFADAVVAGDPRHLLVDRDGEAHELRTLPVTASRLPGLSRITVALPVPGDPAGLAGPPSFNHAALEAGGAVLLAGTGLGLVPAYDARTVLWRMLPAEAPPPPDPDEADRELRRTLSATTRHLVELDVAAWRPELPDLLLNLRHRADLPLPPGTGPRQVETIERAVLCLDIVELALTDEGGAVSAAEMDRRRGALVDLDRAGRRALCATCGS